MNLSDSVDVKAATTAAFEDLLTKWDAGKYATVELLTDYCDGVLKGFEAGNKLSEGEMIDRLESVVNLLRYGGRERKGGGSPPTRSPRDRS